ncbi:MAG: protoporphyrinogen oxidase HemJ [Alphaproteobacteria bacterium]
MAGFLMWTYPWIKALHVISVIAWMAGLLYLPRLYVYHCEAEPGSQTSETFKTMERRLLRGIMNPAMVAAVVFGLILAGVPGIVDWSSAWIWIKLLAIVGLVVMHATYARWRRDFATDRNNRPQRTYRWANEVPTALMIIIVVMAVVKPF